MPARRVLRPRLDLLRGDLLGDGPVGIDHPVGVNDPCRPVGRLHGSRVGRQRECWHRLADNRPERLPRLGPHGGQRQERLRLERHAHDTDPIVEPEAIEKGAGHLDDGALAPAGQGGLVHDDEDVPGWLGGKDDRASRRNLVNGCLGEGAGPACDLAQGEDPAGLVIDGHREVRRTEVGDGLSVAVEHDDFDRRRDGTLESGSAGRHGRCSNAIGRARPQRRRQARGQKEGHRRSVGLGQ